MVDDVHKNEPMFEREFDRYLVFKRSDVEKYLSPKADKGLIALFNVVQDGRARDKKEPFECVCVESDWPEYESVWKMIEERVCGEKLSDETVPVSSSLPDRVDRLEKTLGKLLTLQSRKRLEQLDIQNLLKMLNPDENQTLSQENFKSVKEKIDDIARRMFVFFDMPVVYSHHVDFAKDQYDIRFISANHVHVYHQETFELGDMWEFMDDDYFNEIGRTMAHELKRKTLKQT